MSEPPNRRSVDPSSPVESRNRRAPVPSDPPTVEPSNPRTEPSDPRTPEPWNRPWYREVPPDAWRALVAAKAGWMLDAMDFMLYAMAIGQLRAYFGFDDATAGLAGTVTLGMSAVGGVVFGVVADRVGRTRALMATILIFSFASVGAATSGSFAQLLAWRAILGLGMGGEWASGAVLVSETWPPAHRNKAISIMQSGWAIGYVLAAVLAAIVLGSPSLGADAWRWLFLAEPERVRIW